MYKLCAEFASKRVGGSADEYKRRGEARISKIEQDILTGALGEHAAYEYLLSKNLKVSEPDLAIYDKKSKSFSADLQAAEGLFHVKAQTQESADKYGFSWLCQKQDKILKQPKADEFFIFAGVKEDLVDLKAIVLVQDIIDNELISEPKVWKYRHSKVALYLDDILNSNMELWRF